MTWAQVDAQLRASGLRSLVVRKSDVVHPSQVGARRSVGLPRGQRSDWRFPPRPDCSSMHVAEFAGVYDAHVDAKDPSCDLWGHVDQDVMPAVVGALAAAGRIASDFVKRTSSSTAHRQSPELVNGCRAAIVLVATDPTDVLSAQVDRLTGNLGWSHVYVDPCMRLDGDARSILDFTVQQGVHWSTDRQYRDRRTARIELDAASASELIGCIRARVRQPWSVETFGIDEAVNCVGMVVGCLPWRMQERLRELQVGPCVSPNTLAAHFGV